MALKFLNKKGWHTGSLRNIENVWKAEQKHEAEQKKLEELRKQIQDEREQHEFRQLQEQAGLVPKQERLEFLYDSGLAVGKSSEGFSSLGKPEEPQKNENESDLNKLATAPGALFVDEKPQSANDTWRKLHSDPLLMIRQREQAALAQIKNNPVKMEMIKKSMEGRKNKKEEKERRKAEKKKRRKEIRKRQSTSSGTDSHSDTDREKKKHLKEKWKKRSTSVDSDRDGLRLSDGEDRRDNMDHYRRHTNEEHYSGKRSDSVKVQSSDSMDHKPKRRRYNDIPADSRIPKSCVSKRQMSPSYHGERHRSPLHDRRRHRSRSPSDYGRRNRSRSPSDYGRRNRSRSPTDYGGIHRSPLHNGRKQRSRSASDREERHRSPLHDGRRQRSRSPSDYRERHRQRSQSPSDYRERHRSPLRNEQRHRSQTDVRDNSDMNGAHQYTAVNDLHKSRALDSDGRLASEKPPAGVDRSCKPEPRVKYQAGKLSEEEKAARLREMQIDAELHDEQRWQRLKKASEADALEAKKVNTGTGKNFLDATSRSVYGAEKGGSATIEESVRRRTHYLQGSAAAREGNAFRR
eukprot:Gb_17874 [translate_table: standard]